MLTKRQNLLETIKGGNPDRFVKQYEFMNLIMEAPLGVEFNYGQTWKCHWGITWQWPEGQLGMFPVHDKEHTVIKDITEWKKYVTIPTIETSDEAWAAAIVRANAIDRNEEFVAAFFAPGIFEMTHHLMGMENALMALYEEPEAMHELIEALTQYELDFAKVCIEKIRPDAILHHDDWGSQLSSFISPEMFEEFFLPAYKKIYGFYKANGVELIVHHSDSYAANLVPYMIEMGVDIWQGVMNTNNIPELIKEYGGKISFMGGIHSGLVDFPSWTPEIVAEHVAQACKANGSKYFIPCQTSGLPIESFEGVYETLNKEIDRMSKEMF
ncbi:uroporphyrinogen decarboxylase family protein [Geosporobacter ferrireducens]|uniref:Uroporphyrinogen decarboxylase n=1 Tax=Geosporobacter ferrireducens TaxID=1424294 RepID=A0A1D8GK47_9FIRM|nr:uroporphyrinogen decarboxylase family protein [Geosporobacter ferrireducens]AOT71232.1 uroporphyrinogen decarboxylase [Geosporobacter ferrireducens]MTI58051.1 uroporphyrinogen decarboxylase [Geosporobacter ferrireducens]